MKAAQLLAHFDRVSEAPGAVPRLRRFILDALIFIAVVVGVFALQSASYRWDLMITRLSIDRSFLVHRWFVPCFFGGALLVWVGICWRKVRAFQGRWFIFTAPLIYLGALIAMNAVSKGSADYVPAVTGNAELAGRISLRLRPEPRWNSGHDSASGHADISVQLDGLQPDESANVELWKKRLSGEGLTIAEASDGRTFSSAHFGDEYWNPWSGSSGEAASRGRTTMNGMTVPWEKLKLLKGKPLRMEATAIVSVHRSVGVTRLPFRTGAKWEEADQEITVDFIGSVSAAARLNIKGASADSTVVASVVSRRFGHAARKPGPALDLIHKPSGFRLQLSYQSSGWRGREFTHSDSARLVYSSRKTGVGWPAIGLSERASSHPEEFELIARSTVMVGSFAREVTIDGFRVLAVPGQFAETAIPDLTSPEAVESFFRELEAYSIQESYAGFVPLMERCGPDILPALEEFVLNNPASPLINPASNHARELNKALFKPERPDHRLAFFKGYGRPGLFLGADPSTPDKNDALLAEGLAWVKEDPENRLTSSWLWQMRNEQVPALYPAIRRFLEKEGNRMPWRSWLNMPGLEPPAIVDPPMVSVPRGPSPVTEGEFYRVMLQMTGPQESYRDAVKQGKEWAPRLGAVITASETDAKTVTLWLKVWPEVSDCPSDPAAARMWIQANADRLHFNPETRRYEIR